MKRETSERLKKLVNAEAEKMRANGDDVTVELVPTIFINRSEASKCEMGEGFGGVHHTPLNVINDAIEYGNRMHAINTQVTPKRWSGFESIQGTPTMSKAQILKEHYNVDITNVNKPCVYCGKVVNTVIGDKHICSAGCLKRIGVVKRV